MSRRAASLALAAIVGLLAATAVARLAMLGWDALAADDARYLYVGLSVLDGHGAVTPDGNPYLLRSPAYGLYLALGARLLGGDVAGGAHIAAALASFAALLAATALAWRLGGVVASVATGVALVASPLPWSLLPTLRVDQALAAMLLGAVLVASTVRPSVPRAAAAGALLGVAVLVKEAVLPAILLPVAWWLPGWTVPWARRAAAFVLAAVVVAGWWWLVVWGEQGVLFPLNAIGVIEARQVDAGVRLGRFELAEAAIALGAWLIVAARAAREPRVRPLLVAAVGLLPAAAYAWASGLADRNYLPIALLSAVAIGLATVFAAERLGNRWAAVPRTTRTAVVAILVPVALLAALAGQATATPASPSRLPGLIAAEVRQRMAPAQALVMTFRDRESVALELFGRNPVRSFDPSRVAPSADPADYVWLGLRDQQLFGLTRDRWQTALGRGDVGGLVIVEPHPLAPAELVPVLAGADPPVAPGIAATTTIRDGGWVAHLYTVSPSAVAGEAPSMPAHLDATAAVAWLAFGDGDALGRLVAARPVIAPDASLDRLSEAIAGVGCFARAGPGYPVGWLRLGPDRAGCP